MTSGWSNGGISTPPVSVTTCAATASRCPAAQSTTSAPHARVAATLISGVSTGMTMCALIPYRDAA
jgi:hypothetical protein